MVRRLGLKHNRRMARRGLAAILALVALAVAFTALLIWPPGFVSSLLATERPSSAAGDPVPPISGTPAARIAVVGDTGTGDAPQFATVDLMVDQTGAEPYDGLLVLGDLIYEQGRAAQVDDKVIDPFAPITDSGAELLPVLGNHDYESGEQQEIMTALGRGNPWYVDHLGPVRIIVLDSNRVGDAQQTQWLRATLAKPVPPQTWTVVALHHPPYSAGEHGSDEAVRETWSPLFAEYDVPLVLAGHEHDYQRSLPQDGVTYVISGAGAKLRPTGSEDFTAASASTLHFVDLLCYDERLVGRAIDHSGELVDIFTIRR